MNVVIKPLAYQDRNYVYATARRMVLARMYGRFLDVSAVRDLVDNLIGDCETRIATIPGVGDDGARAPEIQGFIVEAPRDGTIEFIHLRETYADLPTTNTMGSAVVKALTVKLAGELILRRHASQTTMAALVSGGTKVIVRPRSI
jgi:hypothetical protein